jgi:hypothetical protein
LGSSDIQNSSHPEPDCFQFCPSDPKHTPDSSGDSVNRKDLEEYLGWIPELILLFPGFIFGLYVFGKELNVEKRLKQLE